MMSDAGQILSNKMSRAIGKGPLLHIQTAKVGEHAHPRSLARPYAVYLRKE